MITLQSRMQVLELSPELMSLAFRILVQNKLPEESIPEPLQHLQPEDWMYLEFLLISLKLEQDHSQVH